MIGISGTCGRIRGVRDSDSKIVKGGDVYEGLYEPDESRYFLRTAGRDTTGWGESTPSTLSILTQ